MVRQGSVGYPAVRCCGRPLRACVVCQPKWRRTEIPPSPGRGCIKSHPFRRRLARGTDGAARRRTLAEGEGEGKGVLRGGCSGRA